MFVCPACGRAHEPVDGRLRGFSPLIASVTTCDAGNVVAHYLAVWRLDMSAQSDMRAPVSLSASRTAASRAYLYVPAFSLARVVVENLGVRLTQRQPALEPSSHRSHAGGAGSAGLFSPVLLGRRDARLLAAFVHLGLSVREGRQQEALDDEVESLKEQLVYLPAVSDARCIHDAGWRILLKEFDY